MNKEDVKQGFEQMGNALTAVTKQLEEIRQENASLKATLVELSAKRTKGTPAGVESNFPQGTSAKAKRAYEKYASKMAKKSWVQGIAVGRLISEGDVVDINESKDVLFSTNRITAVITYKSGKIVEKALHY